MRTKLEELSELVTAALPYSPQLVVLDEPWFCRSDVARLPDPARRGGRHPVERDGGAADHRPWSACTAALRATSPCSWRPVPSVISVPVVGRPRRMGRLHLPLPRRRRHRSPGASIPTEGPIPTSADRNWRALSDVWCSLVQLGCDPILLRQQSLVSPQCGLSEHSVARRPAHRPTDVRRRPAGQGPVGCHPTLARRVTRQTPDADRICRRSGSRRCAPRSRITTSATTRSTNPRSATPTSTRWRASCERSKPTIPSWPTSRRRPARSAARSAPRSIRSPIACR